MRFTCTTLHRRQIAQKKNQGKGWGFRTLDCLLNKDKKKIITDVYTRNQTDILFLHKEIWVSASTTQPTWKQSSSSLMHIPHRKKKENKKNNNTPQFILNMIWSREMKKK